MGIRDSTQSATPGLPPHAPQLPDATYRIPRSSAALAW